MCTVRNAYPVSQSGTNTIARLGQPPAISHPESYSSHNARQYCHHAHQGKKIRVPQRKLDLVAKCGAERNLNDDVQGVRPAAQADP